MKEPKKPTKTRMFERNIEMHYGDAMTLPDFLDLIKKSIPKKARKNATVEVYQDWGYYDDCDSYLRISWQQMEEDPDYQHLMKKYESKMRKWKKEQENEKFQTH